MDLKEALSAELAIKIGKVSFIEFDPKCAKNTSKAWVTFDLHPVIHTGSVCSNSIHVWKTCFKSLGLCL